jgi:hypothetical protein
VVRSVADAGVVPGAGAALYKAAQSGEADAGQDGAVENLVRAAAGEPYKRLLSISSRKYEAGDPDRHAAPAGGAVDSLATVRGALTHAAATAGRYLTQT